MLVSLLLEFIVWKSCRTAPVGLSKEQVSWLRLISPFFNGFIVLQVVLSRKAALVMWALADLAAFLLHWGISRTPGQHIPSLHALCCQSELSSPSVWAQAWFAPVQAQGSAPTQQPEVQTNIISVWNTLSHTLPTCFKPSNSLVKLSLRAASALSSQVLSNVISWRFPSHEPHTPRARMENRAGIEAGKGSPKEGIFFDFPEL